MGNDTFGSLLRRFRVSAGLSQEELAERAGLSARGIGDLERGRRTSPRPHTIAVLADALGIEATDRQTLFDHARPRVEGAAPDVLEAKPHPRRNPVPIPPNRMLGRDELAATLFTLIRERNHRLVTLTGPGGVGKTLLATVVARAIASDYREGAIFVDLAAINDARGVGPAILRALGAAATSRADLTDQLQHAASTLDAIIVLDNCEHVLAAMPLVAMMPAAGPHLTVLATSRERLHLRGERELVVPPLPLPPHDAMLGSGPNSLRLQDSPAIELFLDRAGEARPGFTMTNDNAMVILRICERLDALPLAIELAAARIRHLSPTAVLQSLDEQLVALADGARDLPERHRALAATIGWSYDLLTTLEQEVFRKVAVFVGGFTLAAAEAVTSDGVFGTLASLVDKGLLLHTVHEHEESRFHTLETIRAFGLERLRASSDALPARNAHARFSLQLAEGIEGSLQDDLYGDGLGDFEREIGNLQAALDWSMEQGDKDTALRLAAALWPFWRRRYTSGIGRSMFQRALALGQAVQPDIEAKALLGAGTLEWVHGDYNRADAYLRRALLLYSDVGNLMGASDAELALGRLTWDRGLQDLARDHFTRAMRHIQASNDDLRLAQALHGLGLVFYKDREHERSRDSFLRAIEIWSGRGLSWGLACCIPGHLGDLALDSGDAPSAALHYRECVQRNWAQRDYENVSWCCIGLAAALSMNGAANEVAWLLGVAERVQDLVQEPFMPDVARLYDTVSAMTADTLDVDQFLSRKAAGKDENLEAAIRQAMILGEGGRAPGRE